MVAVGRVFRPKHELEHSFRLLKIYDACFGLASLVVFGIVLFNRFVNNGIEIQIGYAVTLGMLVLLGNFPPKSIRFAHAQLMVRNFLETRDSAEIDNFVNLNRSPVTLKWWTNTTGCYWIPLYKTFRLVGVQAPASLEAQFEHLDDNYFNLMWISARRSRRQEDLKVRVVLDRTRRRKRDAGDLPIINPKSSSKIARGGDKLWQR